MAPIYVSGLHSDGTPLPGVGTVRCLREALGRVEIIGVDYHPSSTGLSSPAIDRIWLPGGFSDIDQDSYREAISSAVVDGVWISGLDLETHWLAEQPMPPGVLVPPSVALRCTCKPGDSFGAMLGLRIPEHASLRTPAGDLHDFCGGTDWRIWLKAPHHSAYLVTNWQELLSTAGQIAAAWGCDQEIFAQRHVDGHHVSIAFCALRGVLLGAFRMRKQLTCKEGKTWAGRIEPLPDDMLERLTRAVADLGWTGGGEIEMIESPDGVLWLMEVNPRFPSWIYASALAGCNLPALLVRAYHEGTPGVPATVTGEHEFVRNVIEIPRRNPHTIHPPIPLARTSPPPPAGPDMLRDRPPRPTIPPMDGYRVDGKEIRSARTPVRLFLADQAVFRFQAAAEAAAAVSQRNVRLSYSIKTNPDRRVVELAASQGMFADAITQDEAALAVSCGIPPERIILNGPAKLWPHKRLLQPAHVVFADSLSDFHNLLAIGFRKHARYLGIRVRAPATVQSRFGVPIGTTEQYATLVHSLRQLPAGEPLALHFHYGASFLGFSDWAAMLSGFYEFAADLEHRSGRRVGIADVGGGWTPRQFDRMVGKAFADVLPPAGTLPELEHLFLEPGRSLVQPVFSFVCTVIQIERRRDGVPVEIVVDGSITEMCDLGGHPHSVGIIHPDGTVIGLGPGCCRIFGRTCIEYDVLGKDVAVPGDLEVGDRIIWSDAGAYDASMGFPFGRGRLFSDEAAGNAGEKTDEA